MGAKKNGNRRNGKYWEGVRSQRSFREKNGSGEVFLARLGASEGKKHPYQRNDAAGKEKGGKKKGNDVRLVTGRKPSARAERSPK